MISSSVKEDNGELIIRIKGDILSTNAEERVASMDEELEKQSQWSKVTFDLKSARMIDSMGLNALLSVIKNARERGGAVVLQITSGAINRLFHFSHLDALASIEYKPRRKR